MNGGLWFYSAASYCLLARALIAGDYIVRYAIKGEVIYVLKIWHGKNIGGRQPKHATGENMPVTRCN
jgi:hypothetical protein